MALGDVDVDGDLDMVLGNDGYPGQNRLYLNDGTGTFTDATVARMPGDNDGIHAVALGDVDDDDDLDIVFGNLYPQNRLYLNLLRQLDAPFLLHTGHTYTLEAYARYGPPSVTDVALPFLSTGTASIPLPPLGTFGLDPTQMAALPPFIIRQPAGVGAVSFTVPNWPSLVGISLYAQALLVPLPFQAQARLTNVTADLIIQ